MKVTIEIIVSRETAAAVTPEWEALWLASENATPFQSPHWLLPWWDAFAPGQLRIIAVYAGPRLIGLAPLYREAGQYAPRLLPLGISLSDYTDILVQPDCADLALEGIANGVSELDDADTVEWNEVPPAANALHIEAPVGWRFFTEPASACPVAKLPRDAENLRGVLLPSRYRHLKTVRNRARRRGAVQIVCADPSNAPLLLSELIGLHSAAWHDRGQAGVFADSRVQAFHAAALPALMRGGLVRLYALLIGGRTAAVYYGFQHRGRAYAYIGGYDPEFSFESPGSILLASAMERAIREGAEEFHFLRGQEAYKYQWGGQDRINLCLTLARTAQRRAYG